MSTIPCKDCLFQPLPEQAGFELTTCQKQEPGESRMILMNAACIAMYLDGRLHVPALKACCEANV